MYELGNKVQVPQCLYLGETSATPMSLLKKGTELAVDVASHSVIHRGTSRHSTTTTKNHRPGQSQKPRIPQSLLSTPSFGWRCVARLLRCCFLLILWWGWRMCGGGLVSTGIGRQRPSVSSVVTTINATQRGHVCPRMC